MMSQAERHQELFKVVPAGVYVGPDSVSMVFCHLCQLAQGRHDCIGYGLLQTGMHRHEL